MEDISRISEPCSVCGENYNKVRVLQIHPDFKWAFGMKENLLPESGNVIGNTVYCEVCFLRDVWYKNGNPLQAS